MRGASFTLEDNQDVDQWNLASRIELLRNTWQDLTEIKKVNPRTITYFQTAHNSRQGIPFMNGETKSENCNNAGESKRAELKCSREEQLQESKMLINPSLKRNTDLATKDCGGVATQTIKYQSAPQAHEAKLNTRQRQVKDG